MNFNDKVKFIRSIDKFKVTPISEVRALAFAAKEKSGKLYLSAEDIKKITRAYPNLQAKLKALSH